MLPEEGSELGVCGVPEDEGGRLCPNPLRLGAVSPPSPGRAEEAGLLGTGWQDPPDLCLHVVVDRAPGPAEGLMLSVSSFPRNPVKSDYNHPDPIIISVHR